jgi:hypothetical protein
MAETQLDAYAQERNGPWVHLVKWCLDKFETFKDSDLRKTKLEHAEESRQVYAQESKAVSEPWEGAANVTLPLTMITVDNLEPRIVAGLVGSRPYCRLELEGQQQITPPQEALETWWDNELQDVVKIEDVAADMAHDVLLDGTIFVMPRYCVEETTRRAMRYVPPEAVQQAQMQFQQLVQSTPPEIIDEEKQAQLQQAGEMVAAMSRNINGILVDEQGKPLWEDVNVKTYEGGKVEILKLGDVFMPDDVDDDGYEAAPIIRKVCYTYAELMRDSRDPNQTGWIPENVTSKLLGHQTEDEEIEDENLSPAQAIEDVKVSGKKTIECIECYVSYMYRKEDDREEDAEDFTEERLCVLIAVECKLVLRLRLLREVNPQNNHVIRRMAIFRERGCSYGTSVYRKMRSIQDGSSMSFNLGINTGNVKLLPWGFYDAKSGLDKLKGKKNELTLGIGKMLKVDNVAGILFPTMNGDPGGFIQFMQIWLGFWEKAFNIGDLQIGVESSGEKETATASLAKIQEGNIAHNYRAKRSKTGFLGIIQTLWDLYFAWMPLDKTIKVGGQDAPLPRQEMARGYKLRLTASTEMANKLIKRKENEDFAAITGVNATPGLWNQVKVAEDLAKSYEKDNPAEYVNPAVAQVSMIAIQAPQVVPAMIAAAQQAMALTQQIQQGGEQRAQKGVEIEMGAQGGNGGQPQTATSASPPTGEGQMPKFSPGPQDVVKPVGV